MNQKEDGSITVFLSNIFLLFFAICTKSHGSFYSSCMKKKKITEKLLAICRKLWYNKQNQP